MRDAAYATLPFATRRRLHAAVAARLEQEQSTALDEIAPMLSLHYARAGEDAKAWTYSRLAAGLATTRLAFADAAVLHRRALEAARPLDVPPAELADTWAALADALAHTGELTEAHEALRTARGHVRDDAQRTAELLHSHAVLAGRAGHVRAAVRWAHRALRLVEGRDDLRAVACRAQALSILAGVRQREGRRRRPSRCAGGSSTSPSRTPTGTPCWRPRWRTGCSSSTGRSTTRAGRSRPRTPRPRWRSTSASATSTVRPPC